MTDEVSDLVICKQNHTHRVLDIGVLFEVESKYYINIIADDRPTIDIIRGKMHRKNSQRVINNKKIMVNH